MTKQEYDRQRYLNRRTEILAVRREYRQQHRDRLIQYSQKYYKSHQLKFKYLSAEYRRVHKVNIAKIGQEYYKKNRNRILVYKQKYHQEHPECSIATRENRRARVKAAGKLTVKVVQEVYERNIKKYGTLTCYLCLGPIEFGQDSLEHKTPLSRGGDHQLDNLDVAHCNCNASKSTKTEAEYREWEKCTV